VGGGPGKRKYAINAILSMGTKLLVGGSELAGGKQRANKKPKNNGEPPWKVWQSRNP